MSKSGFFNKVPRQSIFREQQVDFFHDNISLDAYCYDFLLSFYIIVSYLMGGIMQWSHPCGPLAELRDRFKGKICLI